MDVTPKETRRTLVTTKEQAAEVIVDLIKNVGLVAMDLEMTGLESEGRYECTMPRSPTYSPAVGHTW
jgi:hypothetical protein